MDRVVDRILGGPTLASMSPDEAAIEVALNLSVGGGNVDVDAMPVPECQVDEATLRAKHSDWLKGAAPLVDILVAARTACRDVPLGEQGNV